MCIDCIGQFGFVGQLVYLVGCLIFVGGGLVLVFVVGIFVFFDWYQCVVDQGVVVGIYEFYVV